MKATIKEKGNIYEAEIELRSKSYLMDCKRKKRSFQNKENSFTKLFKDVVERDNNGFCFDIASEGKTQKESIIQYEETDWEFIKRVASKLKAKLVINVREAVPTITIGKQIGNTYQKMILNDSFCYDANDYLHSQLNFGTGCLNKKIMFK